MQPTESYSILAAHARALELDRGVQQVESNLKQTACSVDTSFVQTNNALRSLRKIVSETKTTLFTAAREKLAEEDAHQLTKMKLDDATSDHLTLEKLYNDDRSAFCKLFKTGTQDATSAENSVLRRMGSLNCFNVDPMFAPMIELAIKVKAASNLRPVSNSAPADNEASKAPLIPPQARMGARTKQVARSNTGAILNNQSLAAASTKNSTPLLGKNSGNRTSLQDFLLELAEEGDSDVSGFSDSSEEFEVETNKMAGIWKNYQHCYAPYAKIIDFPVSNKRFKHSKKK